MAPASALRDRAITAALLFGSGFAGLVYQVLWMRELGFLFGNAAYAVATTLGAFFLGIAAGSAALGNWAERVRRPLRVYAALEAAVALSALLYFGLLDVFEASYEPVFAALWAHPIAFTAAKFGLALAMLFAPAFFMGGTLPMMSQHLVRRHDELGRTVSLLYAINTIGAAAGAFGTAFVLVPELGVNGAYVTALATTSLVAIVAAWVSRGAAPPAPSPAAANAAARSATPGLALGWLAWLSGFATLALEVLWTRMFAQVLHNSVYTFSIILVTFLLALAFGAALASALARREVAPAKALPVLLLGGGLLVLGTPLGFDAYTAGLDTLGSQSGFTGYVLRVFGGAALLLGVPVIWLGMLFPYLLKAAESWGAAPGRAVGRLAALNTLGGVVGSLVAGFVLLETLGLWRSIAAIALLYAAAGLALAARAWGLRATLAAAAATGVAGALALPALAALPLVARSSAAETIVEIFEGAGATIAVVSGERGLRIKHNNHYGLGGSGDRHQEARQAHWPLVLHPAPKRAFFLGMGTGITAGAALQHPLEQLLVTELDRDVAAASRRHFDAFLNGLFDDPRSQVLVEDGRNVLRGLPQLHDVIVADLFLPWKAGVGGLYSREHYRTASERLAPGGLYAQWLSLVQFSEAEFAAVARTMLEVFPRVTLWRANRRTTHPLVLLLGERDPAPLDLAAIERRLAEIERTRFDSARVPRERRAIPANASRVLYGYQGNLTAARELFADAPINTDDRPFVEYSAPRTHRQKRSGEARSFRGPALIAFYDAVFDAAPPETDPVLAAAPSAWRAIPRAGLDFYRGSVLEREGEFAAAKEAFERHTRTLSEALAVPMQPPPSP